ncbi:MAG TPA: DUF6340 family protein [Draconibacterium sp.]|nr:DUF6340 family protein [Draconibacterium sp.]
MKNVKTFLFLLSILMFMQACNTLYNTRSLNIEVLEPGNVKLPAGFSKLAVRYNNTNISYNPFYSSYYVKGEKLKDTSNLDSIASWIYFDYFINTLSQQEFMDTVIEITAADYSHFQIGDSLPTPDSLMNDTLDYENANSGRITAYVLSRFLNYNPPAKKTSAIFKALDPEFGLYSKREITDIADSTGADMLLSLDHFVTQNSVQESNNHIMIEEAVTVNAFWTMYDLKDKRLIRYLQKNDTIIWDNFYSPGTSPFNMIPPRRDAVLNASDMAGTGLAKYLSPHWVEVERFYYHSGHVVLKKTDKLVKEGNWLEAAKIWKSEINNPNKYIAAKCMYNLAVANEIQGNIISALDWVVRSYYVFGEENDLHAENCRNYIQVLAKRRMDANVLDKYYFPE